MKTWFVTGGSSGIGRSVTEKLLARGDRVAATVRSAGTLDDLAAAHGKRLRIVTFDLTDTATMRREVDAVFAAFGHVDVVFGNAGYGLFGAVEEVTDEQIDKQIATNLTGSIQFVRACLPHLRHQAGGRIIQTSSEGGQTTYPGFGIYHAVKWGIEGFIETVALEVAPFGIDTVIVEPGPTGTSFGANVEMADALEEYWPTPAGATRKAIVTESFPITGDAERTADAIIAVGDAERPTHRLVLGSAAYEHIERALSERLDMLRAQKNTALSADRPQ